MVGRVIVFYARVYTKLLKPKRIISDLAKFQLWELPSCLKIVDCQRFIFGFSFGYDRISYNNNRIILSKTQNFIEIQKYFKTEYVTYQIRPNCYWSMLVLLPKDLWAEIVLFSQKFGALMSSFWNLLKLVFD